jgi:hypothetical protein
MRYLVGLPSHQNLSEAVADLLARVLTEFKAASEGEAAPATMQAQGPLSIEAWRPTPGAQVTQTISARRAEREARYQQVESLHKQGVTTKQIARRMAKSRANRPSLAEARSGS